MLFADTLLRNIYFMVRITNDVGRNLSTREATFRRPQNAAAAATEWWLESEQVAPSQNFAPIKVKNFALYTNKNYMERIVRSMKILYSIDCFHLT